MPVALLLLSLASGYLAYRCFSLKYAVKQLKKQVDLINADISQNHMLTLPLPDKSLSELLTSFNVTFKEVQNERNTFQKKELLFKQQIEAISHDLRTPLTVILGYLRLLAQTEEVTKNKELSDTILLLINKSESMKALVTDLYDFSRLSAGDYQLTLTSLDVCRLLRETIVTSYPQFEEVGLSLSLLFPEHPVYAYAETAALERISSNLMSNAIRYATSHLEISMKEESNQVVITFLNDSKDITKEDVTHLFERFYMKDSSRQQGGTGLGLTVAQTLAEKMNGSLTAEFLPERKDNLPSIRFTLTLTRA